MATKKDADTETKTEKKPVLNEDGTPAVTEEERQATIARHQRFLNAQAGVEAPEE